MKRKKMKFKCVDFERLSFFGYDLYIDDDLDGDYLMSKGRIVFYKKDDLFHFVSLDLKGVYMDYSMLVSTLTDIEKGSLSNVDNLYCYNFVKENKGKSIGIEPFFIVYNCKTEGGNFQFNCKNFCIGLNRNQALVFNNYDGAKNFIRKESFDYKILKIDKLFKLEQKIKNKILKDPSFKKKS